jgi:anti-anti-sigma factor
MQAHGTASAGAGLGPNDHVCWGYDSDEELLAAGLAFLADGLALHQRLVYVSGRNRKRMLADVAALDGADRLLESGALQLVPLSELYDVDAPLVPEDQLTGFAAAAEQAVVDGYSGLRVLGDVGALVRDPARVAEHTRWEAVADAAMSAWLPMAALCAYDRRTVADDALADIASVHPLVHVPEKLAPFRLFHDGDRRVLAGELDAFGADRLARILLRDGSDAEEVVVDASGLTFVDCRGLHVLAESGRAVADRGARLVLVGARPFVLNLWRVLGFDGSGAVQFREAAAA